MPRCPHSSHLGKQPRSNETRHSTSKPQILFVGFASPSIMSRALAIAFRAWESCGNTRRSSGPRLLCAQLCAQLMAVGASHRCTRAPACGRHSSGVPCSRRPCHRLHIWVGGIGKLHMTYTGNSYLLKHACNLEKLTPSH